MKLEIWTNSNANCKSENRVVVPVEDLGYTEEEWADMSDEDKEEAVKEFCWDTEMLSFGFSEK